MCGRFVKGGRSDFKRRVPAQRLRRRRIGGRQLAGIKVHMHLDERLLLIAKQGTHMTRLSTCFRPRRNRVQARRVVPVDSRSRAGASRGGAARPPPSAEEAFRLQVETASPGDGHRGSGRHPAPAAGPGPQRGKRHDPQRRHGPSILSFKGQLAGAEGFAGDGQRLHD